MGAHYRCFHVNSGTYLFDLLHGTLKRNDHIHKENIILWRERKEDRLTVTPYAGKVLPCVSLLCNYCMESMALTAQSTFNYTRAQWHEAWGDMVLTNHSAETNQQRSTGAHAYRVPRPLPRRPRTYYCFDNQNYLPN